MSLLHVNKDSAMADFLGAPAALARRAVDAMIEASASLSEIGVRTASEASSPVLSRFRGTWSGLVG